MYSTDIWILFLYTLAFHREQYLFYVDVMQELVKFQSMASGAWKRAEELMTSTDGWKLEAGHGEPDIIVRSRHVSQLGKVLMLEVGINVVSTF